jgi:Bacterial regulatory protein, Fis family
MNINDQVEGIKMVLARRAMLLHDGNRSQAARTLGIPRTTLSKWLDNDELPRAQSRYEHIEPSPSAYPQSLADGLRETLTRRVREGL